MAGSRRQDAKKSQSGDVVQQASAEELAEAGAVEPQSQEQALVQVLDDLHEIEAIDRGAKEELLAELKDADPAQYPLIVEAFRTALAYREQSARREAQQRANFGGAEATQASFGPRNRAPSNFDALNSDDNLRTSRSDARAASANATALANATDRGANETSREDYEARSPGDDSYAHEGRNDRHVVESTRRTSALPPPPAGAVANPLSRSDVQHVAYEPTSRSADDWSTELDRAVVALENSVAPQPRSVEELHDHMRLRLLQLVAGREEAAYRPIPGASPNQQDYLSQQLFALSTFLEADGQTDEKQRAAAALLHLDEARARLAELATLRVGNVAFVTRVDGFGAYAAAPSVKFGPGDPVTVYAEIENYRSESTPDGYRTVLSTSYQIVDSTGRRVAGAQFPEVEDVCRSQRRDFHMQYGVELPSRIYPDSYELQLIVTDQLSNKIGQASVSFDIVE